MTTWSRCEEVLWRRVAGGVLLLPPGDAEPFVVTGPGAAVWDLLAEPCDVPSLTRALASDYGVGVEQVEQDVAPLLDALASRTVVTEAGR